MAASGIALLAALSRHRNDCVNLAVPANQRRLSAMHALSSLSGQKKKLPRGFTFADMAQCKKI